MRLGFGEFLEPGHPEPNWALRDYFLRIVDQLHPQVFAALRDTVLPIYSQLPSSLQRAPAYEMNELKNGWPLRSGMRSAARRSALDQLTRSLVAWADSFHLHEDWVLNRALSTLAALHVNPAVKDWAGLNRSGPFRDGFADEFWFVFRHQGWMPSMFTRKQYTKWVKSAFSSYLTAYLDRIENRALERGLVRNPELRLRIRSVPRRLTWLVQWQVQCRKLKSIAAEGRSSMRTVRAALPQAADELGLRLRKGTPGRPRKSV